MGHTRLKRKKKGWITQKARAQRGGAFNTDAPTKQEMQVIDTFHDYWGLDRGYFKDFGKKTVDDTTLTVVQKDEIKIWHLMIRIIQWLLINYCVPALGTRPSRPLLTVKPTFDFNFTPYTPNRKGGDLFFQSLLAASKIEDTGRDYVKIPGAVKWGKTADNFLNFRSLCKALFPGTNDDARNKSTMHIVCDSGSGDFRTAGYNSVIAAIKATAAATAAAAAANPAAADPVGADPDMLTARISARVSIAGAIAALAQAIYLERAAGAAGVDPIINHIKKTFVDAIVQVLLDIYDTKPNSKSSKKISPKKMRIVIGLIYIAPIIIVNAVGVEEASAAAAGAAIFSNAAAAAATIQQGIETSLQPAVKYTQLPNDPTPAYTLYQEIKTAVNARVTTIGTASQQFDDTNSVVIEQYVLPNMFDIIASATTLIAATILDMAVAAPNTLPQIVAVTTAATNLAANQYNIGPFVKEISTPQRSADSATSTPKPSTIPGDVYPIIYEFVAQGQQAVHAFPEPAGGDLDGADLFYSDSNLYTNGRYEIRYERHQWSPITGLGFKFVTGDIQGTNRRYEVEFGLTPQPGNPGAYYNTLGPSAELLAGCCLKRLLQPPPTPLTGAVVAAGITPAEMAPLMSYDIINQSLNDLLQGPSPNRNDILDTITPLLDTVADNMFTKKKDMFHPYLHFKGNTDLTAPFYEIPPELWFDIKRGGDRDQVMAAYQLSLLTNQDGSPKYPYLVFVTGDRLCGAIAVKKGLATILLAAGEIRYWPKGIVYMPPAAIPGAFTQQFKLVKPLWQMYNLPPADLPTVLPADVMAKPQPQQYSIHLWGGNQMKGGDYFTLSTYDEIEDGYGNTYNLKNLNTFLLKLETQIQQDLRLQQRLQQLQRFPEQYQEEIQRYLLHLLQQYPQPQEELLYLLQQQPPQLLQLSPENLQQLKQLQPQQLQPQQLSELLRMLLQIYTIRNNPENYAFIHNTEKNIEKLLLMNFGSGVEIGKILFAMAALPDSSIICTIGDLITKLKQYRILIYENEQIEHAQIEQINAHIIGIVQNSPNATAAAEQILTDVRTPAYIDAARQAEQAAPVQATAAQIEAAPQWVNDMFAILRFTAIPYRPERDPLIPILGVNAPLSPEEEYDMQYAASVFAIEFKRTFSNASAEVQEQVQRLAPAPEEEAPVLAPAPAPVRAPQDNEANRAAAQEPLRDKKRAMRARQQAAEQQAAQQQAAQGQGGGQQSDIIEELGVGPIFDNINDTYRGGKMNSDNPIKKYIKETIIRFINMPVASIIASVNMFYNTMTNKQIISTPTQPEVDMGLGEKMPAPVVSNKTTTTPLTPVPAQTGQKWGQVMSSTNLQRRNRESQTTQNGQVQYVSGPAASGSVARRTGGKRRTHKKCHTKKTRCTQKNHKRKKHGTQRKRSH
jgi:hypothetical protein